MKILIEPVKPFVDGYKKSDKMTILPWTVTGKLPIAWFSDSRKTCFLIVDDSSPTDKFRLCSDGLWKCLGSGSKQKWKIQVIQ